MMPLYLCSGIRVHAKKNGLWRRCAVQPNPQRTINTPPVGLNRICHAAESLPLQRLTNPSALWVDGKVSRRPGRWGGLLMHFLASCYKMAYLLIADSMIKLYVQETLIQEVFEVENIY